MTTLRKIPRPESGFPAWEGDYDKSFAAENICPVSVSEMAEYMTNCHHQYCLQEAPTTFGNFVMREKFDFGTREFWVWASKDGYGRTWDILVGRGETPIHQKTGNHLWMHGELNSVALEPRDLIAREYPEYDSILGKAN